MDPENNGGPVLDPRLTPEQHKVSWKCGVICITRPLKIIQPHRIRGVKRLDGVPGCMPLGLPSLLSFDNVTL
jgi:hypothetical protein